MAPDPATAASRPELPMRLTRLRVKNFRSIADIDIPLSPLTVLVGPNGSGKSNVVDALRFVRDVFARGLDQAVMDREGMGVIQRWGTEGIEIGVTVEFATEPVCCMDYDFVFAQVTEGPINVLTERVWLNTAFGIPIKIVKNKQGLTVEADGPELDLGERMFPQAAAFKSNQQKPKGLLSRFGFAWIYQGLQENHGIKSAAFERWEQAVTRIEEALSTLLFYDINTDEQSTKRSQKLTKPFPLDEKERNLAAVLRHLPGRGGSGWQRLKFVLRQTVNGFENLEVEETGGFLSIKLLYQTDDPDQPRASYLGQESDGTIRMLGLLAALYQEPAQPFICIEEPEANIHPGALAVLAGVLDEASLRSQVLVTTHSPDMLDHLPAESFLVVEKVGDATHVGLLDARQLESVRKRLFTPGEFAAHGRLATPNQPRSHVVMRTLQLLVEGKGDIQAAPTLLGRLLREEHSRYDWIVEPKHVMKVWGLTKLRNDLERFVEHLRNKRCDAALILLDLEDQLPCQEAPALAEAIAALRPLPFPIAIVFAYKEYEAWFLAGMASIAAKSPLFGQGLIYPNDPEGIRGPKEWLSKQMPGTTKYNPALYQAEFTKLLSFEQARRAPSFQRLERALAELLVAVDSGSGAGLVSPRRL